MFISNIQNLNTTLLEFSSKLDNSSNISGSETEEYNYHFSLIIDQCNKEVLSLMSKLTEKDKLEVDTSSVNDDSDQEKGTITRELLYSVAYEMIDQWREEETDLSEKINDLEPESTLLSQIKLSPNQ